MNVFDIIGPVMIGPSSSHTAGACRIGNYARAVSRLEPKNVKIILSGSFARTYKGHGTDKAIVAGLMGFDTSDKRIKDSLSIAKEKGYNIVIELFDIEDAHPNTCKIIIQDGNKVFEIEGASIGGGNIIIKDINGVKVSINGMCDAIVIAHKDIPGMIYHFTKVLYEENININGFALSRSGKNEEAVAIIEVDDEIKDELRKKFIEIDNVLDVCILHKL